MSFEQMAKDALEKRAAVLKSRQALLVETGRRPDQEQRKTIERLDGEMLALENRAREHIESAREVEVRSLRELAAGMHLPQPESR